MAKLHITKVAVGCASLDILIERLAERAIINKVAQVTTRYRPTRHAELIGGSLFWIIKSQLVARQTILGFSEMEDQKRWIIHVDAHLVPVRPQPRRVHQGWRYLADSDAPRDMGDGAEGFDILPDAMRSTLTDLGLV